MQGVLKVLDFTTEDFPFENRVHYNSPFMKMKSFEGYLSQRGKLKTPPQKPYPLPQGTSTTSEAHKFLNPRNTATV